MNIAYSALRIACSALRLRIVLHNYTLCTLYAVIDECANTEMTSAEPSRRAPYSADLRWRVVWQKIAMELPYKRIAANLNIATGTAVNIYRRFCNTGGVKHTKQPQRLNLRVLTDNDELFIIGLVLDNPSLYLSEMRQLVLEVIGKGESINDL